MTTILIISVTIPLVFILFLFMKGIIQGWKNVKKLPPPDWYELVWGKDFNEPVVPGKVQSKRPKFTVV